MPKDTTEMSKLLTEIGSEVRAGKKDMAYMQAASEAMQKHLSPEPAK
jgi:hypothetical protein